jgi:hypothetical protein
MAMQEIAAQPPILIRARSSHRSALDLLRTEPLLVYDCHSWGGRIAWSWIEDHAPHGKVLCELDSLETIAPWSARASGSPLCRTGPASSPSIRSFFGCR